MNHLIGLDIGTSSVKAVLMSENGKVVGCKTRKYEYYYKDGFKLLDATQFCEACFEVIKELSSSVNKSDEIVALCPSGASGNLVFVKNGEAVSPIYGWQNEFDKDAVDSSLSDIDADFVYKTTGWPKLYSFPLAALSYFKKTNPSIISSSDKICMHIEYLNFMLTGKWGITLSMATPFYLINQQSGKYEQKYLSALGISESQLPGIVKNCSVLGSLCDYAAQKTGLKKGTSVVAGTFDHPSAARGAGVFEEGDVLVSCGTSWVVFIPFSKREMPQSRKILTDPYMYPDGNWCGMKSMTSVSETIDAYIKKYLGDISFEELDELADTAPIGANGLLIDNNTDTNGYSKNDIARAVMESIARRLDGFLKELEVDAKTICMVGGITKSKVWCRVISEITGKNVSVVNGEHAGAVGSAFMAGVGVGIYKNELEAFDKNRLNNMQED